VSTIETLREQITQEGIDFIDLRVVDLIGRWRHVTIPAERFDDTLTREGIAFDGSNLGYAGVEGSDLILRPDLQTGTILRHENERFLSMICNIHLPKSGERFADDPRAVASRAENHLCEAGIADSIQMSPEFEFYVFCDAQFRSAGLEAAYALKPLNENVERSYYHVCPPEDRLFALRNRICKRLADHGVNVKYHHHEVGAYGQIEIEIGFSGLREAADITMTLKNTARSLAAESGWTATFLPKPIYAENGNGMHVHQFLQRGDASLFEEQGGLSDLARCYIGGLLTHGPSLCALTNPSTNSYRRLVPGYEAPVWFAFGEANRSAAIRIPRYASSRERRIELRTADATCNPYLAYAAMVMAGIDGISRNLDAAELGLGPHNQNLYDTPAEALSNLKTAPANLEEALLRLESDHEYLLAGGVFSEGQIEDWIRIKRHEAQEVRNRPHPYEYSLYFDL